MTYDMKPLACDPTRIKGMSEQLIIELVATSSTRFKPLITKTGAVAKSSSASARTRPYRKPSAGSAAS